MITLTNPIERKGSATALDVRYFLPLAHGHVADPLQLQVTALVPLILVRLAYMRIVLRCRLG